MSSRPFPALCSDIPEFQGLLSRLQRPPEAITTGVTPFVIVFMVKTTHGVTKKFT